MKEYRITFPYSNTNNAWRWCRPHLDQVIVGGESGPKARHMDPDDARFLRDQCADSKVSFFMKQMSGSKRSDREAIPEDLQIREFPQ